MTPERLESLRNLALDRANFAGWADVLAECIAEIDRLAGMEAKLREAEAKLTKAQQENCSLRYANESMMHDGMSKIDDIQAKLHAAESSLAEEKAKVHQLCIGREEYNKALIDFDPMEAGLNYLEGGIRAIKRAKAAEEACVKWSLDYRASESSKAALEKALEIKLDNESFFHPDDGEVGYPDLEEFVREALDEGHNLKVGDKVKVHVGHYHDIELKITKEAFYSDDGQDQELEYEINDPVRAALSQKENGTEIEKFNNKKV